MVVKNDSITVWTDQSTLSVGSGGSVNSLRGLFDSLRHSSLFSIDFFRLSSNALPHFRAYPLLHQHLIRTAPYGKWIILQFSCWIHPPLSGLAHMVL